MFKVYLSDKLTNYIINNYEINTIRIWTYITVELSNLIIIHIE